MAIVKHMQGEDAGAGAPPRASDTFGGLAIAYDARVLTPRDWTVAQAAWAAEIMANVPDGHVLDLFCGAGQIGLLSVLRSTRRLVAVDIDPVAIAYTRENAEVAGLSDRVETRAGSFGEVLRSDETFPLIIADPPWVPREELVRHPGVPLRAIDGGETGLDVVSGCVAQIERHLAPGGTAILQLGTQDHVAAVRDLLTPDSGVLAGEVRAYEEPGWGHLGVLLRLDRAVSRPRGPVEPPPSRLVFPDARTISGDIVAVSRDFTAGSMLTAFRRGIFPWPRPDDGGVIGWYSPNPRAVLPLDTPPRWKAKLRQLLRNHPYEVTRDMAFVDVINACADRPEGTWLFPEILAAYRHLHELGWGHSVEVWDTSSGTRELVGGAFGVAFGGLFSGDSMYHRRTDCGKIAFMSMAEHLHASGFLAMDLQVTSPNLASLGCIEISRNAYLDLVERARSLPVRF